MSCDTKNIPKSLKISKNDENKFLQYLSTRSFMHNPNPRTPWLIYTEKQLKITKNTMSKWESPGPLYTPL